MQKEAQPSTECIEMNILFRSLKFLLKKYPFLLILCNFIISLSLVAIIDVKNFWSAFNKDIRLQY